MRSFSNTKNSSLKRKSGPTGSQGKGSKFSDRLISSHHPDFSYQFEKIGISGSVINTGNYRLQPKLKIGQPNDKYEQEADRMADHVMRMADSQQQTIQPAGANLTDQLQMKCTECEEEEMMQLKAIDKQNIPEIQRQEEEEEEELQMKADTSNQPTFNPSQSTGLVPTKGGGSPLPDNERDFFETRFGHDFSNVRIHHDSESGKAAKAIHARAFTLGNDIVFGPGQFNPDTHEGKKLLAHELTHVIQQGIAGNRIQKSGSETDDAQCKSTSTRMDKGGPSATICFPTNSDELDENDKEKLDFMISGMAVLLNQQPLKASVLGFADTRGDIKYNLDLSERRAFSVARYIQNNMRSTAYSLTLEYEGGGETGPAEKGLRSEDLSDYRVVEVFIDQGSRKPQQEVGCENIKKWLESGAFNSPEYSENSISKTHFSILESIVAKTDRIDSPEYGDSFPLDLYFDERSYINFSKDWSFETYKKSGGKFDSCSSFNYDEYLKDYIGNARQFIISNPKYYRLLKKELCEKAGWWGKSNGEPDIIKVERDIDWIIDHTIGVRNRARMRAATVDHPCEMAEQLLIVNDIIAELQENPNSLYHSIKNRK